MTTNLVRSRRRWYTTGMCGLAVIGASGLLAPSVAAAAPAALPAGCMQGAGTQVTCTFTFTGNAQSFTVPEGITSLAVTATGGRGGNSTGSNGAILGGLAAVATGQLTVAAGDALYIQVGGNGGDGDGEAGYNGGGGGGTGASGGGGASDVRTGTGELADRKIVASGGGGAGDTYIGGAGNNLMGAVGQAGGGGGGGGGATDTVGGPGGNGGSDPHGSPGEAGVGGAGAVTGGGGGGGWFGGGGGTENLGGGGGGGGSSYAPGGTFSVAGADAVSSVVITYGAGSGTGSLGNLFGSS
ncbi:glycine-rich protein [Rhodococcus jostii]|uniref:glycine-rich protein n=1 Tax=Rhodococcus jostii TaxID=132919 RepID=UPI00093226BD|nr:glycine-rich protein [Rhodococcus jostii]